MARSISFDVAAVDKASKALEAVAREVTDLERKLDGAGGTIEIDADTGKAREQIAQIDSQLARLNAKSLKIDADTAAAKRDLQVLEAEAKRATGDRRLKVDADIAAAQARLRALDGAKVAIDVETAAAQAKLAAVEASLSKVDGDRVSAKVDVDSGGMFSKLAQIGSQLRDLKTPVMIPVAIDGAMRVLSWIGSVSAGLASLGAAGVAAGGVTAAAFVGVSDAVTELGKDDAKTAGGMSSNANSVARAVHGVELAQRAVRDATEQVSAAQRAQVDAAAGVAAAQRAVQDAVKGVTTAQEASARAADQIARAQEGVVRAQQRVSDAERTLSDAQRDATRVQQGLNDARKEATRQLEDLQRRTSDMALDQESAALSVLEAEQRVQELQADPTATDLQRKRAELAVREAQARARNLADDARRLAEDKATADAKGVEGSDLVTAALDRQDQANRRVKDAQRGVKDAQDGVRDATRGVDDAQRAYAESLDRIAQAQQTVSDRTADVAKAQQEVVDRARDVRNAQEAVSDRLWDVKDAQLQVQEASKGAGGAATKAADDAREAFSKLTPEGQRFAQFLRDLVDGPLKLFQDTAQAGLLPGLQSGIDGAMENLGRSREYVKDIAEGVGRFFDQIGPSVGRAVEAFLRLAKIGGDTSFGPLADGVSGLLDRFTAWANSQSPEKISSQIRQVADDVKDLWDTGVLAFRGLQAAWEAISLPVDFVLVPLESLVDLLRGDLPDAILEPVEAFRGMYDGIRGITEAIPGMRGMLPDLSGQFDRLEGAVRGTDGAARGADGAARGLAAANRDLEGATRAAKDELLRGEEAGIRYEGALDRAQQAVKRNGAEWSVGTEKGYENRQALLDLIRSSDDYIVSLQNQGANVQTVRAHYVEQRQKLIDVATQMGMTKTQAQQYIDKLLQIPSQKSTRVTADTSQAMTNLQNLQNKLAAVNGALSVTTKTGTYGQGLGVYKSSGGWVGRAVSSGTPFGGGPRGSDTVPGWLDPEEFVVRAGAAKEWGPLLELINRGASPAEMSGALGAYAPAVPAQRTAPGGGAGGGPVVLQFTNLVAGQEDAVTRAVVSALGQAAARGLLPPSLKVVSQ